MEKLQRKKSHDKHINMFCNKTHTLSQKMPIDYAPDKSRKKAGDFIPR